MKFAYNLPVNLIFGIGVSNKIGSITAEYGKKALIVTGQSSTKKSGLLEKVMTMLSENGIEYELFDKVTKNPLDTIIYEGVEVVKETECDVVIGIGGGSIMDAAKSIAFCSKNPGDLFEYIFGVKDGKEALPIILVPTTCGTGSEGNGFSVITNSITKDKKSLRHNSIIAKAAIVDPELMVTMPKRILASVGFDALAHNMESYLSKISNPFTEMESLYGIKLLAHNLPIVYSDYSNMEAWEKVALASTIGGMAIGAAGVTAPHGMEHPASGLKNIVHGEGLAALTPIIVEKSWSSDIKKYSEIAKALGGEYANDCSIVINEFLKKINLKVKLGDLGITENDIDWMTNNCYKVSKASMLNHPKIFSEEEIREIYYRAI